MLLGHADPEAHAAGAPRMQTLDAGELTLRGVELLQLLCEIDHDVAPALLPSGAHPTLPGVVGWLVWRVAESPWGPFRLAQTRIQCRSGTRPRGFLLGAVVDNARAGEALAAGWGYRVSPGEIDFRRGFDTTEVEVRQAGLPILAIGLRNPVLLPPDVVQFVSSLHPAHTPRGYRLVQVDLRFDVARAERGEPIVDHFDGEAWGDARVVPRYAISAAVCLADVTLVPLRFLCRPGELAFTGTEGV